MLASVPDQFGFVPCYVNSRLTAQGIPVSCEVDIYGALSEFIGTVVSGDTVTLLDINNSVPEDMFEEGYQGQIQLYQTGYVHGIPLRQYGLIKLAFCEMKYQKIMARALPQEVTQGTLEGDIIPGDITFFRLQSTADSRLRAYIAHGEVLPVATRSFGGIGVFAIPEMGRFYRHVLIEGGYPHHGAVAFGHLERPCSRCSSISAYRWKRLAIISLPPSDIRRKIPGGKTEGMADSMV